MQNIFRLALRNLREHKSKTLIIALFFVFGIAVVVLGNSFLESVNRGFENDFRANYTGDIVFSAVPEEGQYIDIISVGAAVRVSGDIQQIPALPEIDTVLEIVESKDEVANSTKLISAQVLISNNEDVDLSALINDLIEDEGLDYPSLPMALLFGVENPSYWETFSGNNILEGNVPRAGTNEVLLESRVKRNFERAYGEPLEIGSTILFTGNSINSVIRECVVSGFFNPPNENTAMYQIAYSSPEFARSFADLTYGSTFKEELPAEIDFSLSAMDEDALFGDAFDEGFSALESAESAGASVDWNAILGDTSLRDELNRTDDGAWNFILLKLKNPSSANRMIAEFQNDLRARGIENVQVMDWERAAMTYTGSLAGIGSVFNILIVILAIVVFIIIMNTMTVSVIERTGEIGTMRAIGAEKKFIRRMFFAESVTLTLLSSLAGIALAFVVMAILNPLNIMLTESGLARMALGGGILHFSPTLQIIISVLAVALLGSVISNLYPVSSALKITPLEALSQGNE